MLSEETIRPYHDFAVGLAEECGEIARKHFSLDVSFEAKGDNSPVTVADKEINRHVIERCKAAFPDVPVMGEEESAGGANGKLLWVCDPIDGTTPYALGMHASTFCLALVVHGMPVLGVVYDFMNDRLYHAVKGWGTFLNGEPISMPSTQPLKLVNFEWWHSAAVDVADVHDLFFAKQYQLPNYTSSGYMGLQVALGRIAGQVYMGTSPWDAAALKVVAEECGATVFNLDGEDKDYSKPIKGMICAHPAYYDDILATIKAARKTKVSDDSETPPTLESAIALGENTPNQYTVIN